MTAIYNKTIIILTVYQNYCKPFNVKIYVTGSETARQFVDNQHVLQCQGLYNAGKFL